MTNSIQFYAFGDNTVRVFGPSTAPCFIAVDVYRCLGLSNPSHVLENIPEEERGIVSREPQRQPEGSGNTPENGSQLLYVTEPGLYRLIFRSDKPAARKFQDWVFKEVLPKIRKTGAYGLSGDSWRELFVKAKTGQVQLALLRAAGVLADGAERKQPDSLVLKRATLVTGEMFWERVSRAYFDGKLERDCFRVDVMASGGPGEPGKPEQVLRIDTTRVMELVFKKEKPVFASCIRAEYRMALAQTPEWIEGKHNVRFTAREGTTKAWAFRIGSGSPRCLVDLLVELKSEKPNGGEDPS